MDVHPYVALARRAIAHYLGHHEILHSQEEPGDPPPVGLFVSLHEPAAPGQAEGPLRGCIGSTAPTEATLRDEIARIAVSAAMSDPRFPPLTPGELDDLDITVYLLDEPERVADVTELDPARYGVVLRNRRGRIGLLLPAIPGIATAEQQVDIARQKGRFLPGEELEMYRFEATILH